MLIFLRRLLQFVLLFWMLLFLIQALISWRIYGKTVRGHDNLEQTENVNAELVFLGSSRCWSHFDPAYFRDSFGLKSVNIGVDGHSEVTMTITRLETYLAKNSPPRFAIYNLDPFVSAGSLKTNTNFVHKNDFARYAFFPHASELPMVSYFKFDFFEKYLPLYAIFKYGLLFDCLFLNNRSSYVRYGYEKHYEKWDTIKYPLNNSFADSIYSRFDNNSLQSALLHLKKVCEENSIQLICIQTPVYRNIFCDSLYAKPEKICKVLDIPFIDANAEFIMNDIENFYNSNHLNCLGVAKMNEFLKDSSKLKKLLKSEKNMGTKEE